MLLIQFAAWLMMFIPQEVADIAVPEDVLIWGGLSLSAIFRIAIVPILRVLGLLTDANKKTVGGYLIALGVVVAAIFGIATEKISDPRTLFTLIAAGGFAGIGAVGLHSTQKNLLEYFRAKKQ